MFTIDSKKEYQFFISMNYDHYKTNIKLTGFSRYDNLRAIQNTKRDKKLILIIPTGRISPKRNYNCSGYNPLFKKVNILNFIKI